MGFARSIGCLTMRKPAISVVILAVCGSVQCCAENAAASLSDRDSSGRYTVSVRQLGHSVPKKARKLYEKARALLQKDNITKTIRVFRTVTEVDPYFAAAQNDLGPCT
jgi:hypothetical protein